MKNSKRILSVYVERMLDTDPDISYLTQDEFSDRLQAYNDGQFEYIGIRAEAEIALSNDGRNTPHFVSQEITSGGLWGIESDSDDSYLTEVEQEQLTELRAQLKAIGFSARAISAAFKNIERKEA